MLLLVVYGLIALGVSFLCSLLEAVLLSVTPSFVGARAVEGTRTGRQLRVLKDDVDRPLAAILSLNTIAHTAGAAGVGAQAVFLWGSAALGIASAALTLMILVLSEIIPKTLGALYWRQFAGFTARTLIVMIWVLWPLVKLSQGVTRVIARRRAAGGGVEREEIHALAELGARDGTLAPREGWLIQNVLSLRSLRTEDIMTPRTVMRALPLETPVADVLDDTTTLQFSRIPVYEQHKDHVTGYVLKDQVLLCAARDEHDRTVGTLAREIVLVPESLSLPDLFSRLMERGEHIAVVVDEYGGTAGIVTMEDVVETVLGLEIVDELDSVEDMQGLARQQWYRRARRLGLVPEGMADAPGAERGAKAAPDADAKG
ncbi:MAG: hemolysin family protein [Gemmatimonadales bacterium]|jgi:CBS domain containing-hemolysin-like protein